MPIYEYKCRVCEEHFEVEQSFTDDTLTELDGCTVDESGRHHLKKVFAAPAIAFKGDGFYRNDARSSTNASSTTPPDGSPAAPSTSDSSKSDSPASTSPSGPPAESSSSKTASGDKVTSSSSSTGD